MNQTQFTAAHTTQQIDGILYTSCIRRTNYYLLLFNVMFMKEHEVKTLATDFQTYQSQHSGEGEGLEAQLDERERQKERMESEIEQLNTM